MKVLYIVARGGGGSSVSLSLVLPCLRKKGIAFGVIATDEETRQLFENIGAETFLVPFRLLAWPPLLSYRDYTLFIPRFVHHYVLRCFSKWKVKKIVTLFNPDIIHTNTSVNPIGYEIAKSLGIPHIWHIREYIDKDFNMHPFPSFRLLRKKIAKSYTITISKDLECHFQLDSSKNRIIYNGIRNVKEQTKNLPKENYFLYVGRLSEGKGLKELLQAFSRFCQVESNHKLYIAGSGMDGYVAKIKDYIVRNSMENRVELLGQRKDIDHLMSKAKALIVPSVSEGFGRISAEAMFNKCLVIGNNTAGTKEQFDNGLKICGQEIGIRYNGTEELLETLQYVACKSSENFDDLIECAYRTVQFLYTPEKCANEINDYYQYVLSSSK